jgi:hypothetical protein
MLPFVICVLVNGRVQLHEKAEKTPKPPSTCNATHTGDTSYATCGDMCKEAKAASLCKWCKCQRCSFCGGDRPAGKPAAGAGLSGVQNSPHITNGKSKKSSRQKPQKTGASQPHELSGEEVSRLRCYARNYPDLFQAYCKGNLTACNIPGLSWHWENVGKKAHSSNTCRAGPEFLRCYAQV